MTRRTRTVLFVVAGFLATAAVTSAQEPAGSFDALAGSMQVGQRIWVTDVTGREVRGRLERLSSDGLTLKASGLETFAAADVRRVRARARDSLKNGALIGLAVDAVIRGKVRLVYQAPLSQEASRRRCPPQPMTWDARPQRTGCRGSWEQPF